MTTLALQLPLVQVLRSRREIRVGDDAVRAIRVQFEALEHKLGPRRAHAVETDDDGGSWNVAKVLVDDLLAVVRVFVVHAHDPAVDQWCPCWQTPIQMFLHARVHEITRALSQHAKLAHDTRSAGRKTDTASFLISIFSSSVPGSSSDALVAMVELASSAANKTANAA